MNYLASLNGPWPARLAVPLRVASLCLLMVCWAGPAVAQADHAQAPEHQVKAAFLFKFGGYVEWPPQAFARPDSPLEIAIAGSDAVADELTQMAAARVINGHTVTVRRLRRGESAAGAHILFVARSERGRLAELVESAKGLPMLVVTELPPGSGPLGVINFVVVDDKVRFDIAVPPAESSNVKISARLLGVARKVISSKAS